MNSLQEDVNVRAAELNELYQETADMVPGYTREAFIANLKTQLKDLERTAKAHMSASAGHLNNDDIRIEIFAIKQIVN